MPREDACLACRDADYHRHRAELLGELAQDLFARAGRWFAARDDARAFEVRAIANEMHSRVQAEVEYAEKFDAGEHTCTEAAPTAGRE